MANGAAGGAGVVGAVDHVATLEDLRKNKQVAEEQGWELYANDLGDQIRGMEQVLRELALPADERPKNRGGRKATNETEH